MMRIIAYILVIGSPVFVLSGSLYHAKGTLASTGPSDTPISVAAPNLPGGQVAVNAPPAGSFFKDFQPPYPTNSWWTGFTVSTQDTDVAGPYPFQAATSNGGLIFGLSNNRNFDGITIKVPAMREWIVGIEGLPDDANHRKAVSWDTQTVCLQYFNDNGGTMDTCLVPGSPYMTFTFKNAAVNITSDAGKISKFEWVTPGSKALLTNSGGNYILYTLGSNVQLTLSENGRTLSSPGGFSGTLRLAKVKVASQEALLDKHSATYATGMSMSYTVDNDVSTQTWTWDVVGNAADLLILSWPHHRKTLVAPNYVDIEYRTLKGYMRGVQGNVWTLKHNLPTISWFAQNPPHQSCVSELGITLEAEVANVGPTTPGDFVSWGKQFGKIARLALIAEHIGRNDLVDKVVTALKESIKYWFDPAHTPAAAYETGWGGFINKAGWDNSLIDYGNAYYNEHHFQYGYFLTGAAVIGKYDADWLNQNKEFISHVARDIGNPSPNDPYYTVTRHLDFFAGHSWANGISNPGSRNQGSSSEAINGYYGVLLFAHAIQNQALIDYARMILAIEIAGAQEYWHMYPDIDSPYPEKDLRAKVTIGNVLDTQTGAFLNWGGQRIQISGSQILPLTPMGQSIYDDKWIEQVGPYCQQELDDPELTDEYRSVIHAASAKVNPQKSYTDSQLLFNWGPGNSATNHLYFVATQASNSDICTASTQTPTGLFNIQDAASGKFVTVAGNGHLAATTEDEALATKFTLSFYPGGSTIRASNGKFVTASPEGNQALSAAKDSADGYEIFRWTVQSDGTYELTAMVNRFQVSTGNGDGELFNNAGGTSGVTPSRYRLKETGDFEPIPASGVLKSVQSGKFVVATAADPTLRATGNGKGDGTIWSFELIPDRPEDSPYYALRSQTTTRVVTGSPDGTSPLVADRDQPSGWEHFQILPYNEAYIIIHVASGLATALQGDNTLIDNNNGVDNSALWTIE